MKNVISTLLFLALSYPSISKQILFSDDFESYLNYNITNGWKHEKSDLIPWKAGIPYLVGGACFGIPEKSHVACIPEACSGGFDRNNSNVLMYTPQINMSGLSGAWLRYDSYFKKVSGSGLPEKATVEVSTNGGVTWTVVQDVPANANLRAFSTYYIDLSAYSNVYDLRIGFRYNDNGGNKRGWAVDNVEVFIPAGKDLALMSVGPDEPLLSFCEIGKGVSHTGTVFNAGLDTIHAFNAYYQQGVNGPVYGHTVSGVTIPPFATYTFTHSVPDTIWQPGQHAVTMYVELAGDQDAGNDMATSYLTGAFFIPKKRVAIELGTATWNSYAPEGLYLLDQANKDPDICPVAVHDNDPMEVTDYTDYLYNLNHNYVPYYLMDRRRNVSVDSLPFYIAKQKEYFGYADVYADAVLNGNNLSFNTHVNPAIDLQGDYRLILIVTEDDVTGNTSDYDQRNRWAGGALGPMGGYENKTDPVPYADMRYNMVARKLIPAPNGTPGMFPATMSHNTTYHHIFSTELDPGWSHNLKAMVFFIDNKDGAILNSFRTMFYLNVPVAEKELVAGIYPNPANTEAKIYFEQQRNKPADILITDMTGKKVFSRHIVSEQNGRNEINIPTFELPSGLYIVNLALESGRKAMKLQVVH